MTYSARDQAPTSAKMRVASNASRTGFPSIDSSMSPGRTPTSAGRAGWRHAKGDTPASASAHMTPSSGTRNGPRSTHIRSDD